MPEIALKGFIDTLTAVSELTAAMNRQSQYFAAQNKPIDLNERQEKEDWLQRFKDEACSLYDSYIKSGLDQNTSISKARAELKDKGYAYATYEIVKDTLRKSGKFQRLRIRKG